MKKYILFLLIILCFFHPSSAQRLLKDIASGTGSAGIYRTGTYSFGDTLYFRADTLNEYGSTYQYYFTTGSSVSTKKLLTDSPLKFILSPSFYLPNFHKFNGKIYGFQSGNLVEIRNDSLKIIKNFGSLYAEFLNFFELNNSLYFLTFELLSNRYEFWQTDGTDSGTILYKSISNDSYSYNIGDSFIMNNTFYKFISNDSDQNTLLFTNGTSTGTSEIINNRFAGFGLVGINNEVYFSKSDTGQYWYRHKLYKSQGDSLSTIRAINDIDGDANYGAYSLVKFKNEPYFYSVTQFGTKLSKYDVNTSTIIHITPSRNQLDALFTEEKIYCFSYENNAWHFYENSGSLASETLLFSTTQFRSSDYIKLYKGATKLYILQSSTTTYEIAYWVFDGQNLTKIQNLRPDVELGVQNNSLGVAGDYFYFSGGDEEHGYELWRTDGITTEETFMLKDINKTVASSFPKLLFGLGNYLYLMANDIKHGSEIWRTDGISSNLYADLNGSYLSKHVIESLYYSGAKLNNSFIANLNRKLYKFSENGSLEMFFPYIENISKLCSFKESVYFNGNDYNLWKTDGTVLGTKQAVNLDDTNNGIGNWGANVLTKVDTMLFFSSNYGSRLWRTNGTKNGTLKLAEFQSNEIEYDDFDASDYPTFNACGKNLFFERRNTSINAHELWASDGTIAGTQKVADNFNKLGCFNDKFYFNKDYSLWESNGTVVGTFQRSNESFFSVKQLRNKLYLLQAGNDVIKYYQLDENDNLTYLNSTESFVSPIGYSPSGFIDIDNRFLLNYVISLTNPQYTYCYLTDGNKENIKKTFVLRNSIPIGGYNFTYHNKKVYFSSKDSLNGQELWVLDFECPDGFTERDSIGKDTSVVYGKYIWGQNVLHNSKNVVYDAKNSIILQPGFEVKQGTVFRTNLIGCNNVATPSLQISTKNEPLIKIVEAENPYPQLEDFLNFQPNSFIRQLFERFRSNKSLPITWNISIEKEIYRLDFKVGNQVYKGFLPR